jgi:hypothetical protein
MPEFRTALFETRLTVFWASSVIWFEPILEKIYNHILGALVNTVLPFRDLVSTGQLFQSSSGLFSLSILSGTSVTPKF